MTKDNIVERWDIKMLHAFKRAYSFNTVGTYVCNQKGNCTVQLALKI